MTASSTSTVETKPFNIDDFLAVAAKLAAMPRDPIEQMMIERGCDPRGGGILFLPDTDAYRGLPWGPFGPPSYVRFSPMLQTPFFGRDMLRHPLPYPQTLKGKSWEF